MWQSKIKSWNQKILVRQKSGPHVSKTTMEKAMLKKPCWIGVMGQMCSLTTLASVECRFKRKFGLHCVTIVSLNRFFWLFYSFRSTFYWTAYVLDCSKSKLLTCFRFDWNLPDISSDNFNRKLSTLLLHACNKNQCNTASVFKQSTELHKLPYLFGAQVFTMSPSLRGWAK